MLSSRPTHDPAAVPAQPSSGPAARVRDAVAYCLAPARLRRTLAIAVIVGTLLTLINQGDVLLGGRADAGIAVKAGLNYLIPFLVSNLGLLSGRDAMESEGTESRAGTADAPM